jgi:environmental stress-induced protein Ves
MFRPMLPRSWGNKLLPPLHIVRRSSFKRSPWKNGGGITHEAMRVPATGDPFLWRVSVAQIDSSGPFSDFAGYDRKMVLLQGPGIELIHGNGQHRVLRNVGDCVEFAGAIPTHCELLGGPCVDLNLIVAESLRSTARVERLVDGLIATADGETTLIFGMESPLSLESDAGETVRLEPWDLAVLSQGSARLKNMTPDQRSTPSAVFIATISH